MQVKFLGKRLVITVAVTSGYISALRLDTRNVVGPPSGLGVGQR